MDKTQRRRGKSLLASKPSMRYEMRIEESLLAMAWQPQAKRFPCNTNGTPLSLRCGWPSTKANLPPCFGQVAVSPITAMDGHSNDAWPRTGMRSLRCCQGLYYRDEPHAHSSS